MSSRTKIIVFEDHFATGEPTVQLVSTWGRSGKLLREKTSCHKLAAHSPALDYISSVEPEDGKTTVLVIGLGDHETYGANRNGDGFPSKPVPGKIEAHEVLPLHYKSYENARVYEHHANSDPDKAIGSIKKAFWNPFMRRVEVVEDFVNSKAPHLLEKIAAGEYPAKSMGCKIKYDVCNVCGNKAKTRADYCDHLKFAMSHLDPNTGIKHAALNPSPNFFDSSWVVRPADRTGYMLKKVAEELYLPSYDLGEYRDDLVDKAAALGKAADIEKIICGEPAASVSNLGKGDARLVERALAEHINKTKDAPVDDQVVKILISYKPSKALGTAEGVGLPLGIRELIRYFMGRMLPADSVDIPEEICKSAGAHLGLIYSVYQQYPRFFDDIVKLGSLSDPYVYDSMLAQKLAAVGDYLSRQVVPAAYKSNERPRTDMLTWTDPNTGKQYVTNYGTVQKTHDRLVEKNLLDRATTSIPLLAGSVLLGAATLGMSAFPKLRGLPQAATALGTVGLGGAGALKAFETTPLAGPKVLTDQGETISGWTEMKPKHASLAPEMDYLIKRAHDSNQWALPTGYIKEFVQYLKTAEIHDDWAPYVGPTLSLDKVAQALGTSLLNCVI